MLKLNNCGVGILGIGSGLPEKVLTNHDLEKIVDTSDEWIVKRTGISERRILDDGTPAYKLGVEASVNALNNAGIKASDIDLIIVATDSPDYLTPATSCLIQRELGASKAAAFDINAACSGLVYASIVAQQFISSGYYRYVLVIGCEGLSRVVDWKDRNICVLLGDGAGAFVLGPVEEGYGIISSQLGAEGNLSHNITIPCCYLSKEDLEKRPNENKRVMWMDGSEVFKFAVKVMAQATIDVVNEAGIKLDDVEFIVPHQANIRIIDGASKRIGIKKEKVIANVEKYGNISSASIPVALDMAIREKKVRKGAYIVLVGFGGGLTWAAALLRWSK
ncbi:MAG: beta-ketoacyl-ACP synthase III [Acetivibrionales bacterium]